MGRHPLDSKPWERCKVCGEPKPSGMFNASYNVCVDCRADKRRAEAYNVGVEEYDELVDACKGLCVLCEADEALVVDHDHLTGAVRGMLCNNCNTALGLFYERKETLARAIDYLSKHEATD